MLFSLHLSRLPDEDCRAGSSLDCTRIRFNPTLLLHPVFFLTSCLRMQCPPAASTPDRPPSRACRSKEMQEKNGGSPIYKAHPGLKCITITDHASGKWFFNQPDTVLDRQVRDGLEKNDAQANERINCPWLQREAATSVRPRVPRPFSAAYSVLTAFATHELKESVPQHTLFASVLEGLQERSFSSP